MSAFTTDFSNHMALDATRSDRPVDDEETRADALWFVSARNLGDTLAYQATTIGTLRGLVPLPGRSLAAGVQMAFQAGSAG